MLISLFERCMKRRGVRETDPYDWEKPSGDNVTLSQTATVQQPVAPSSTIPRHTKHTPTTDNNQENIEPTDNKEVTFKDHYLLIGYLMSGFVCLGADGRKKTH